MRTSPPVWAEAVLRTFLKAESFPNVSGDLLEQYRDSILPARGLFRADRWYVSQVFGFVLRGALPWAALFAAAAVARNMLDWLNPATDYHARALTSTALAVGILLVAGFWTAWRSGSFLAGAVTGLSASTVAAGLTIVGNAVLLALSFGGDPAQGSGGLDELFHLPVMLILPGMAVCSIGGFLGAGARRFSGAV